MRFYLRIGGQDEALVANGTAETIRILREVADLIESGKRDGFCRDINGNSCGAWSLEPGWREDKPCA